MSNVSEKGSAPVLISNGNVTERNASAQRHMARTAGRWKDGPKKNTLCELQDELMSVRLREAEAQAELRETRQRMLEQETQVRRHIRFLVNHIKLNNCFDHCLFPAFSNSFLALKWQ